jgi:hypothetical protein
MPLSDRKRLGTVLPWYAIFVCLLVMLITITCLLLASWRSSRSGLHLCRCLRSASPPATVASVDLPTPHVPCNNYRIASPMVLPAALILLFGVI